MFSNKKRRYFLLNNQLEFILPHKDYTPKKFMWSLVMGLKKHMSRNGADNSLRYLEHKPGFTIKENSIKYWCDHLTDFRGWEQYVPDPYIKKIKSEALKPLEEREYIPFDAKFLLSLFRSLNEARYS